MSEDKKKSDRHAPSGTVRAETPPEPRKVAAPASPSTKRRIRRKPASSMDALVGVFIFAFGLGAVLGVGYLGYARFYKDADPAAGGLSQEISQAAQSEGELESVPQVGNLRQAFEKDFTGNWQTRVDETRIYVSLRNGEFQIVMIENPALGRRLYSVGYYDYDPATGVMTLKPSMDLPQPKSFPGADYRVLTARTYKIFMIRDVKQGLLVWKPYAVEGGYDQYHPLFSHTRRQDGYLAWVPLK